MTHDPALADIYPGINRLQFFLLTLAVGFVYGFTFGFAGPESTAASMVTLPLMIGGLVLNVARLRNIGASQWWAFLAFVPVVNLVFGVLIQAAQPGWSETRRLDGTGKIIAGLSAAFFVVLFGSLLLIGLSLYGLQIN